MEIGQNREIFAISSDGIIWREPAGLTLNAGQLGESPSWSALLAVSRAEDNILAPVTKIVRGQRNQICVSLPPRFTQIGLAESIWPQFGLDPQKVHSALRAAWTSLCESGFTGAQWPCAQLLCNPNGQLTLVALGCENINLPDWSSVPLDQAALPPSGAFEFSSIFAFSSGIGANNSRESSIPKKHGCSIGSQRVNRQSKSQKESKQEPKQEVKQAPRKKETKKFPKKKETGSCEQTPKPAALTHAGVQSRHPVAPVALLHIEARQQLGAHPTVTANAGKTPTNPVVGEQSAEFFANLANRNYRDRERVFTVDLDSLPPTLPLQKLKLGWRKR